MGCVPWMCNYMNPDPWIHWGGIAGAWRTKGTGHRAAQGPTGCQSKSRDSTSVGKKERMKFSSIKKKIHWVQNCVLVPALVNASHIEGSIRHNAALKKNSRSKMYEWEDRIRSSVSRRNRSKGRTLWRVFRAGGANPMGSQRVSVDDDLKGIKSDLSFTLF